MNSLETKAMPAPPSLMKSLMAGFDAISNQTYVILFAISLDIFLWLGPHLKVTQLVESFITQMQAMPELQSPDMAATMKLSSEFWTQVFKEFNLFSLLRTFPIGVPSLMISQPTTASNPFGLPLIYEISSWGVAFGLAFLLLSIGVVLGSLYFLTISQIAVYGEVTWKKLLREWPWATLQIILLTLAAFLLILAFLIPISCILSILFLTGLSVESVGVIVVMIFGLLFIWWMIPLVFTPFGVFLYHQTVWNSFRKSLIVARMTLPRTSLFILAVVIISIGMDYLWLIPPVTSWWTLVGIIGHAFVSAGLLAATFIYFNDASNWVNAVAEQAKIIMKNGIK